MQNKNLGPDEILAEVTNLSSKLKGMAFLFSNIDASSGIEKEAFLGISELLSELADQSQRVKNLLEKSRSPYSSAKKGPTKSSSSTEKQEEEKSVISVSA